MTAATASLAAAPSAQRLLWVGTAAVVALQVAYPLVAGSGRDGLAVATVVTFFTVSVAHAVVTRGVRYAGVLVAATAGGGLVAELVGVHTGRLFGDYAYADSLGPAIGGVPLVIPLAWTMFAHPAVCAASRLARGAPRILVAAWALASWDVFLDPQMVGAGHWTWYDVGAHLPGVGDVPLTNFGGWLAVALVVMAVVAPAAGPARAGDTSALALYLWTFGSSLLANVAFFGRPWVALWGGLAMGVVALPLVAGIVRQGVRGRG